MELRKEQILILAVLALAALQYRSIRNDSRPSLEYKPKRKSYEAQEVVPAALVDPLAKLEVPDRDLFREPSETQPLPPRSLPFPERPPLTVLPVPLSPGPQASQRHRMRVPGTRTAQPVEFQLEAGAAATQAPAPGGAGSQQPADDEDRWARTYDLLDMGPRGRFHGIIEHEDKIALEAMGSWSGMTIYMRVFSTLREKLEERVKPFAGDEVRKIVLAKTLRNEVERRKRAVPADAARAMERGRLIEWMLQQARNESWVYQEAAEQADLLIKLTNSDLQGFRWKVRVFREQGDLAAEYALFQQLPESSFRYEGLGLLKERLGLLVDAEADLQKAVELAPNDPSARASLALFLCKRQRASEALPHAQEASRLAAVLGGDAAKLRAKGSLIRAHLALGRFGDAQRGAQELADGPQQAYLRGAVAYAMGDLDTARTEFETAAQGGILEALLGTAACQILQEEWQAAKAALDSVADQAPLLRHRAQTGLAFLYSRTGNGEEALVALDRALEADPTDPYAHYLRGHILRRSGALDAAETSLQEALRFRDDLLHALAEMALCKQAQAAEAGAADAVQNLVAAVRYVDRLVELESRAGARSVEFLQLQGMIHFAAADMRGAREAFEIGRGLTGTESEKLYCRVGSALVDYAQGRVDEAQHQLDRLAKDPDLALDHPFRNYAKATGALIDDHSQKEVLVDRFQRDDPGEVWIQERDGPLRPRVIDDALVFRGKFDRGRMSSAQRQGALEQAGRFLAVQVKMKLGTGHQPSESFAGLRLQSQVSRSGAVPDFVVELGLNEGMPFLLILDGKASGGPDQAAQREPVRDLMSVLPGFDPAGEQKLELRVEPRDETGQQLRILAIWNDTVVHQRDLRWLRTGARNELMTILEVSGRIRAAVDVTFDDYRLERRKDG